jgi:hypothetical protein
MVSSEPLGPDARRGFLVEKRRVGTASFGLRTPGADLSPRLASFSYARVNCDTRRSHESPYIAERYLPRLITRREWRVLLPRYPTAERVESSNAEGWKIHNVGCVSGTANRCLAGSA